MSVLTHTERRPLADLLDWLESPLAAFHPFTAPVMRVEDYVKDGRYVIRAELPGIDPEQDLEVTVADGILTIKATREEKKEEQGHSEFRYGSFSRRIALPDGADDEHVQASYDYGILEVTIGLKAKDATEPVKRIPVRLLKHIKPT